MRVKLGEIADVLAGQSAPQGEENYCEDGIPFVRAGNLGELLSGKKIGEIQKVNDEVARRYKLRLFKRGSVLFAKSGMSCLKGYVYILPTDAYVVNHLACIIPKKIEPDYLRLYFQYHKPNHLVKDEAYPSISLSDISRMDISVPCKDAVRNIIKILTIVETVIFFRKQQITELDTLIKARFVEMFGNPVITEIFPRYKIGEVGNILTGNTPSMANDTYYDTPDIPFIKPGDISENGITNINNTENFVSSNARNIARIFPEGSVLVTCIGTIGKIGISLTESCCNQQINVVIPFSIVHRIYLAYCLLFFKPILQDIANAPVVPILNKSQFSNIEIPVPPINEQYKFATFVEQVDKSKFGMLKDSR